MSASRAMPTNWETTATLKTLLRLVATPPLKSPAPQLNAELRPKMIAARPELITVTDRGFKPGRFYT
jgi:hypothetical protein